MDSNRLASNLGATGFPEGESSALAVSCPGEGCGERIWIGASQLHRRGRRAGTGCKGDGSCAKCGCRVHVEMDGLGGITVEKE